MQTHASQRVTAFLGDHAIATGALGDVALTIKRRAHRATAPLLVFADETGHVLELDLRGSDEDVLARVPAAPDQVAAPDTTDAPAEPRGRGRPRLGVVAREVTLLPRHWEWLSAQPGGASVALRKLVEAARRDTDGRQRERAVREAAYRALSVLCGDRVCFEEATRALFAGDPARFAEAITDWPPDVRAFALRMAFPAANE